MSECVSVGCAHACTCMHVHKRQRVRLVVSGAFEVTLPKGCNTQSGSNI